MTTSDVQQHFLRMIIFIIQALFHLQKAKLEILTVTVQDIGQIKAVYLLFMISNIPSNNDIKMLYFTIYSKIVHKTIYL